VNANAPQGNDAGAANTAPRPKRLRVLCIDDEFSVLKGIERVLNTRFDVTAVTNGADALVALEYAGPFAVIVSDFRLIETDGVKLLARVAELAPTTVRLLLTGQAAMNDTIAAINDGHIFGYVRKPCPPDLLLQRVAEAALQYERLLAEKQLLEETMQGAIKALMDLLALTCPVASGRAMRLSRYASLLAAELKAERWDIEMAAMLSQLGCLTIAPELVERICRGAELSADEEELALRLPSVAERILAAIPRADGMRGILRQVNDPWSPGTGAHTIPIGSRILRVVADFDRWESAGNSVAACIERLSVPGPYDPAVVGALSNVSSFIGSNADTIEVPLSDVERGMIFATDVRNPLGILLIARGQDVTVGILERVRNHWGPFADRVLVRVTRPAPAKA
jgi:response regulator RpfG family c-di-GMP phosphodiesterase